MRASTLVIASFVLAMTTPALAQQSPNVNRGNVNNVGIGVAHSHSNSNSASRASSRSGVNIRGGDTRIAPTVVAPGLAAAGIETCLGSFSAGGSFVGGGISFGGTMRDSGCDTRLTARTLWSMGYRRAAISVLCSYSEGNVNVAEAMALGGTPCVRPQYASQPYAQQQSSYQQSSWNDANGNRARSADPFGPNRHYYGGTFESEQRWMNGRR